MARDSTRTSANARFMPLAPVGGTMCAASPARNSRPCCIGSHTNERIGVMPLSKIGPSLIAEPAEVVGPLVAREHAIGNRRSADAVEAVAAGDHVALDLLIVERDPRSIG